MPRSGAPRSLGFVDRELARQDALREREAWDRNHRPHLSAGQAVVSVIWTLAPLATLGLTTWAVMLFGAIRLGSRRLAVAAAVYALIIVGGFVIGAGANEGSRRSNTFAADLFLVGLIGTLHAVTIRREVFAKVVEQNPERLATTEWKRTRTLRKNARQLAAHSPQEALDLLVGRVDLPAEQRTYDDGGLIDVNNVADRALAAAVGIDAEIAARIGAIRVDVGGFDSVDDLSVALDLPAKLLDTVADRLIFLPLLPATAAAAAAERRAAEAAAADGAADPGSASGTAAAPARPRRSGGWFGIGRGASGG